MFPSISSYTWLPLSFISKLRVIHEHGFEGVEIFATPRHLDINNAEDVQEAGMLIRDLGFRHVSMHAPSSLGDLSIPDETMRDDTVLACQRVLDAAMLMGADTVTFHPSSIEEDENESQDRWYSLIETLRDLSGYAEDRDIRVAIENFPQPLFGSDPLELYNRLEKLSLPNVGMCLDIGHAFVGGHLPHALSKFGEKIFSVHASDNRGNVDEHMAPGHGKAPWEEILDGLRQLDFRGPFVIEVRDGRKLEQILEDVIQFCDRLGLSEIGQLLH
ncbi:MAG: sugar phosphate isomerase/epimerase family protein [Candidatus Hinthialibacter sp.]